MSYINGTPRGQSVLFPATLDEYLDENNAVRAIDAFIEYLPFNELRFVRGEPAETDGLVTIRECCWGFSSGAI